MRSDQQVFLTAVHRTAPSSGPALTATHLVPDLHHYNGRGGRAYPLWLDAEATEPNLVPGLLALLTDRLGRAVTAPDVVAYIAAVVAHPAYTRVFADDLTTPGIRVPVTAEPALFDRGVELGRRVLWLHTYGERFVDPQADPPRPAGPPRTADAPMLLRPFDDEMPDALTYDPATQELRIGDAAVVGPVAPEVRAYEISGVNVIDKWFGYRRATRVKPKMGDRRDSQLQALRPESWPSTYTTELLELLHVLTEVVALEPEQQGLLEAVVSRPRIGVADLTDAGVLPVAKEARRVTHAGAAQGALDV